MSDTKNVYFDSIDIMQLRVNDALTINVTGINTFN